MNLQNTVAKPQETLTIYHLSRDYTKKQGRNTICVKLELFGFGK